MPPSRPCPERDVTVKLLANLGHLPNPIPQVRTRTTSRSCGAQLPNIGFDRAVRDPSPLSLVVTPNRIRQEKPIRLEGVLFSTGAEIHANGCYNQQQLTDIHRL